MIDVLDHTYETEWRLFTDSSNKNFKAVLLHNGNEVPSVLLAYGTNMKEKYDYVKKIEYEKHIGLFVVLCEKDSTDRIDYYVKKEWPKCESTHA